MIFRAIFWILILVLGWNSVTKTTKKSDFRDYYQASQKFVQSEDIYTFEEVKDLQKNIRSIEELFTPENLQQILDLKDDVGKYIYPPSFAFFLIPISGWEYETAARFFGILNYGFLLLSILLLYFRFRKKTDPWLFWASMALALLFSFRFLENHINNNQVAFILLFLVLVAVFSRNAIFSGVSLALAIVIKLTPAVFLVYFFWKRRWMSLVWTFVFIIGWLLLPGLYSWEDNLRYLGNWNDMVLNNAMKNPVFRSWQNNQSMIATLAKYFLPNADINQHIYRMPWIELSVETVKWIFNLIFVGFGISLVRTLYSRFQRPGSTKVLSLLFILSVLFSGIAWIHSFVFFLFPLFFLFREYLQGGLGSQEKKWFYLGLSLLFLTNKNFIGGMGESSALMVSSLLYGGIVLFFLIANLTEESVDEEDNHNHTSLLSTANSYASTRPIRIAVDARPLAFGVTGNSRYLAEVLEILGRDPSRYRFLLFSHKGIHPVFEELTYLPAVTVVSARSRVPGPLWLHTVFPWKSYFMDADLIWGTLQLLPAFGQFCPMMVNYHDLNVKSAPQTMAKWNLFQHRLLSGRTLKRADSILCLSQNTIRDIGTHYSSALPRTVLVYPGVNEIAKPLPPENSDKLGKFLFTLGTLEPRKNLKTLIEAYLLLKKKNPSYPYNLVAAGRVGWGENENRLREALKEGKLEPFGIFFLENPNENVLSWLYKHSKAFVFPSLHEGFGLPLLEAMREGKNCIASDIPVFSEILDPVLDRKVAPIDEIAWSEALEAFALAPPPRRKWNPKDWTWNHASEMIAGEIQKLHAL